MEQKKNELGNIYGTRISKNGNWLNLLVVTHINGQEVRITCPVRLNNIHVDGKPYAFVGTDDEGKIVSSCIMNLPVYEDKKPTEEQAAAEDSNLPF